MSDARCRKCNASVLPFAERCGSCGAQFPADEFLDKIIRHNIQIQDVLGVGGMGTVYKGMEMHLQRPVAVKVLNNMGTVTKRHVAYFMREAQVLSRLRHPNLVAVLDFGQEEDGTLFLVLEYIPGQTLDAMLEAEFPFSHARALRILIQILGALEEVHRHSIVHRDLKPGNIVLEEVAGQKDFVKVLDFGIAKILGDNDSGFFFRNGSKTEMGMAVGTPQYMSPEQAQGRELDARSDIYSAGLLLYEILTGQLPHESENILTMMVQRIGEEVPPPSERKPELGISAELDALCMKALTRDPDERFANSQQFRQHAQAVLGQMLTGPAAGAVPGALPLASPQTPALARAGASPLSRPTLEADGKAQAVALAIRPLVIHETSNTARTEADRLLAIWDFLGRAIKKVSGQLLPPDRGMALAIFPAQTGGGVIRAAHAALELREQATRRFAYARLQMGLAPNTGAPSSDDIGQEARALAQRAMAGQILVQDRLKDSLGRVFELSPWDKDDLELVGLRENRAEHTDPGHGVAEEEIKAGFIGRRDLRRRLDKLWRRMLKGKSGQALVLVGEDGVGKSHTLGYIRRMARKSGIPVLEAYADKRLIDRPFRPLFDIAMQAAGQHSAPAHRLNPQRFRRGLEMLGVSQEEATILFEQFVSGTQNDPWLLFAGGLQGPLPYAKLRRALHVFAPFERRLALTGALRSLLRQATSTGAAVVVLEDLDNADIGTLGCLPGLCDLARSRPLLFVATARHKNLLGIDHMEAIDMAPLERASLPTFWRGLQAIRSARDPSASVLPDKSKTTEEIFESSQGMPIYLSRWLEHPIEPPPADIEALIAAQFGQMPGRLRRLLLITSTLGSYFEEAALGDLFPKATSLTPALEGAAQGAWIEPCPGIQGLWRFQSPVLQRIIYQSIPPADRNNYHRHIYGRIQKSEQDLLIKAMQAWRCQSHEETAPLAEQLGDRFTIAGAPDAGHEWYMVALEAMDKAGLQSEGERQELLLKAASTLALAGHASRAARLLSGASFRNRSRLARGGMLRSRFLLDSGELEGAARCSSETLKHVRRGQALAAGLKVILAEATARAGREEDAILHIDQAIDMLDQHRGDLPDDLLHYNWQAQIIKGSIATRMGKPDAARQALEEALERALLDEDAVGVVQSIKTLGALLRRARQPQPALDKCLEALQNAQLKLQPSHKVMLHHIMGQCRMSMGQEAEAKQDIAEARRIALELGWHAIIPALDRHMQGRRKR